MAKLANQKLKLIYLQDILLRETDAEHPMGIARMQAALMARGVEVRDRKSLYDDLEALRVSGLDIVSTRMGKAFGYYVAGRDFELAELKLLVDAVQSSRFITHRKTSQLIAKVEALTSVHQARQLQRQVYVAGRIKAMNESIFYNVDALSAAIAAGRQIAFTYYEWALTWGQSKVERQKRRQGASYRVSPWALCWAEENYYLVAFDAQGQKLKHYRVDKMQGITVLDAPREGGELMQDFDIAAYGARMFGMFGGEPQRVRIRFANRLVGVVVDRFGREVFLSPEGEGHFSATVDVAVSPQFLAWVISFGREARVLSPQSVAEQVRQMALAALDE